MASQKNIGPAVLQIEIWLFVLSISLKLIQGNLDDAQFLEGISLEKSSQPQTSNNAEISVTANETRMEEKSDGSLTFGTDKLVRTRKNSHSLKVANSSRSENSEYETFVEWTLEKIWRLIKIFQSNIQDFSATSKQNLVTSERFLVDEIATELDTLENKKDSIFSRYKLRQLIIPMLVVLKLFKLKLLLFLPLILGLVSFKKVLAISVVLVPSLFGLFQLFKPTVKPPFYTQSGLGYSPVYKDGNQGFVENGNHNDVIYSGGDLAYQGHRYH